MTQKHGCDVYDYRTNEEKAQPWCEQCNLQEDICRCHDDAIPGDVAAALLAKHSAAWCERLSGELSALLEAAKDAERHQRIWDSIEAQLRVAQ